MRSVATLAFVAALAICTGIEAQTFYLPAVAHTGGFEGTTWRSDVQLKATGAGDATVRLEALRRGQANTSPPHVDATVPAGRSLRLADVLDETFALNGAAALRVTVLGGAVVVASRTFNDAASGTYGQYVPALAETAAITAGGQGELVQLAQSSADGTGFRTNIGLLNTTALQIEVSIALYRASGELLGTLTVTLQPFELDQVDKVFAGVTGAVVDDGYAIVTSSTAGARFLAYASVIDNRSGDAVFMPGQLTPAPSASSAVVADHHAADAFSGLAAADIDGARTRFSKIFYGHTSHGSQIVTGLEMLETESAAYAAPDLSEISEDLGGYGDLGWESTTRAVLGQTGNGFSMVVWSWCGGLSDNTPEGVQTYLDAVDELERDYPGVVFVYMTGHLDGSGAEGTLRANNELIRSYCRTNGKVLFDFADIESWDPDGVFHPDDDDSCMWCSTWCASHACPPCGDCAHSHCLNCERKGRAFWWLLATLARSS